MSKTDYAGIDYGLGRSNVGELGIRYGVIHQGEVLQAWADDSEANYNNPSCPKCGNEALIHLQEQDFDWDKLEKIEKAEHEEEEYLCEDCKYIFGSESAIPEDPYSFSYDRDGYACEQGYDDPAIFIFKSPHYTWCQFCSPCAPGAGYTMKWTDPGVGIKAYCFGHDWFEDNKAPYPVYSVETDELMEIQS